MERGFEIVKSKRRRPKPDRGKHFSGPEFIVDYVDVDVSVLLGKINEARSTLTVSSYLPNLISIIEESCSQIDHLLCYGLGSFSDSYISRHQLAALLAIKNHFECETSAYDPVFSPNEVCALTEFDIHVIEKNDEAKRTVSLAGITLVYFAHCSSQLVNNFLWANWSTGLRSCVILSNSFSTVIERNDEATVQSLACLRDVIAVTRERIVDDTYDIQNVFNDLSVHTFPPTRTTNIEFWAVRPEPDYTGQIVEFCTKDVVITLRPA